MPLRAAVPRRRILPAPPAQWEAAEQQLCPTISAGKSVARRGRRSPRNLNFGLEKRAETNSYILANSGANPNMVGRRCPAAGSWLRSRHIKAVVCSCLTYPCASQSLDQWMSCTRPQNGQSSGLATNPARTGFSRTYCHFCA